MKPGYLLAILIVTLGCGQSDTPTKETQKDSGTPEPSLAKSKEAQPEKKIFDIKSAKIEFKYSGGPETGTEILYFDDYGNTAVLVIDKKTKFSRSNSTIIWKDRKGTILDHEKKTASKAFFRPKSTEPPGIAGINESSRKSIGYEKLGDETIAGKVCEVWYNAKQNIKYALWNKVDLKLENQGVYTKEALSAEENITIPASLFEIPKDYKQ